LHEGGPGTHFVLSGFAPHLASHFGRSVSKHGYGYVSQPINQTVLPATLQIPDPSCNMRASCEFRHDSTRYPTNAPLMSLSTFVGAALAAIMMWFVTNFAAKAAPAVDPRNKNSRLPEHPANITLLDLTARIGL
jgi:hypothetical protein